MEYSLSNSLVGGSKSLNSLGLSLDLRFAEDKSLTARKGPTPTFTRASTATYYGPLIDVDANTLDTTGVLNGRALWFLTDGTDTITLYYNINKWQVDTFIGGVSSSYQAAVGSEYRPDLADWSAVSTSIGVSTSPGYGHVIAATNEPRFDHDITTELCKGLLIEESRLNIVFPSNTLTTQTRSVTATPYTLSFYGTGTIVLSGVAVATVTGTGSYPIRTTLTFTPTAGNLVLTVTGSVTQAQLEAGAFPTSYIPTTTGSAIRSVDLCSITGAAFTGIWSGVDATMFFRGARIANQMGQANWDLSFGTGGATSIASDRGGTTERIIANFIGFMTTAAFTTLAEYKIASALKTGDYATSFNGASVITSSSAFVLTLDRLSIGMSRSTNGQLNGWIHSMKFYKKRLTNAKLQSLTT
jgi:hypothetical protein